MGREGREVEVEEGGKMAELESIEGRCVCGRPAQNKKIEGGDETL